jgi:O-antigen ligase
MHRLERDQSAYGVGREQALAWGLGLLVAGFLMALYPFHFHVDASVGFNASYGDVLIGVLGIAWLFGAVGVRRLPRFSYAVATFVGVAVISALIAWGTGASYFVPEHSAVVTLKLLGAIAWFVGIYVLCTRDTIERTQAMALVSVLLATYFAAQTVNQGLFMDQLRPEGPFLNPNIYANYLVLNGFLAAYLVGTLQPDRPLAGTLLSLTMPLFAASLVVTASRGALFGAAVGVAAVPILYPGRDPRKLLQPIFVLPAVLSGVVGYFVLKSDEWINDRVTSAFEPDGKNVDTRIDRWEYGLDGFFENPITGVGYGQSQNYVQQAGFNGVYPRLHNTHLTVLSETGLVGALAFYALFGLIVLQSVRLAREHDPAYSFLGAFVIATLAAGLVTGVQTFRSLWIAVGIIAALSYHHSGQAISVEDVRQDVDALVDIVASSVRKLRASLE